ncbi:hypothetical protein PIROE2DRAFT_10256 [Piromyces sp. E2]|nr:hypothetical protein PIROE2DRAFT_10256 [Piromyces sp. E2]|eukprot:OUM63230.1 hypothetical protein PIROE2DRAFT_10256 [Piromyces sp. E2]
MHCAVLLCKISNGTIDSSGEMNNILKIIRIIKFYNMGKITNSNSKLCIKLPLLENYRKDAHNNLKNKSYFNNQLRDI